MGGNKITSRSANSVFISCQDVKIYIFDKFICYNHVHEYLSHLYTDVCSAVARALIGGCIFIYSGSARLVSFEIKLISKEVSQAEPEYMNIHPPPPINVLATALDVCHC